jgi:hypothetical protein
MQRDLPHAPVVDFYHAQQRARINRLLSHLPAPYLADLADEIERLEPAAAHAAGVLPHSHRPSAPSARCPSGLQRVVRFKRGPGRMARPGDKGGNRQ